MSFSRSFVRRVAQGAGFALVFSAGYALGTLDAEPAEAQVGEMGKDLLNKAAGSGGALGSAAQLGTTISDMQTHVTELQKNLETLNKIKAALGGT
jgi:hypothetical protein